jgi:hypothetical protein
MLTFAMLTTCVQNDNYVAQVFTRPSGVNQVESVTRSAIRSLCTTCYKTVANYQSAGLIGAGREHPSTNKL